MFTPTPVCRYIGQIFITQNNQLYTYEGNRNTIVNRVQIFADIVLKFVVCGQIRLLEITTLSYLKHFNTT